MLITILLKRVSIPHSNKGMRALIQMPEVGWGQTKLVWRSCMSFPLWGICSFFTEEGQIFFPMDFSEAFLLTHHSI